MGYPCAKGLSIESISFKELSNVPLIMPSQSSNSNKITTFFSDDLVTPQIAATYNLIFNAGLMVEAGIGYAICIDGLINLAGNHPLTFIPFEPKIRSNIILFTKKYQVFSKATRLFLDRLKEKTLT